MQHRRALLQSTLPYQFTQYDIMRYGHPLSSVNSTCIAREHWKLQFFVPDEWREHGDQLLTWTIRLLSSATNGARNDNTIPPLIDDNH